MAASGTSGGDFLARKSDVTRLRAALPPLNDVLIIEDEALDSDRLTATLRLIYGYELSVRVARTIATSVDAVMASKPQLVFLDDVLKPADSASQTLPYLRRAGFEGPVVVVSGQVTRQRRQQLLDAGAQDVIHKDDVDSVRLGEALLRLYGKPD